MFVYRKAIGKVMPFNINVKVSFVNDFWGS